MRRLFLVVLWWWKLTGRAQLWCRALWWTAFAGQLPSVNLRAVTRRTVFSWTLVERADSSNLLKLGDLVMSLTMEQVVTQLQQEMFALRAQVAAESGLADAVRPINYLTTAQVRKDTPSLIDVKGLGRPKEFSGKEKDFQQWSKKTEAFFAGVIQESEMMLEWAAEQTIEITMTSVNLEFLPSGESGQRCAKPGVCVAADAHGAHGSHEL